MNPTEPPTPPSATPGSGHDHHDHGHTHQHDHGHDHGHRHEHPSTAAAGTDRGTEGSGHHRESSTHGHAHGSGHGHHRDRGIRAMLRYLRLSRQLWRSEVNDEIVRALELKPGERVVDLGSGMGAATVVAAKQGASVVAVDPTPFLRRILKVRRLWQPAREAISVLDGAAEALPVPDQSIDALWTVNTLHHWTDPAAAARELARVMRPGGRILLLDEDFANPAHHDHAENRKHHAQHRHHFAEVDVAQLAELLIAAGFSQAEGSMGALAGRPAKIVRATR